MKKIIVIVLILLLIGLGLFFFLGNGKEKVEDFFADNSFGSFFDINTDSRNDNPPDEDVNTTTNPIDNNANKEYSAPILRQISFEPISGYTFYSTTTKTKSTSTNPEGLEITKEATSTSIIIRFQERATGHIYDVHELKEAPEKILNITNPKIYNSIFLKNKDKFLYQQPNFNNEQVITSFSSIIFSTSSETTLEKKDISSIINDFLYINSADKLVYSMKQNQISKIFTSNTDRTGEKEIITLPFNEFLIESINPDEVLITTKASQTIPGYSYVLNLKNSSFNKVIGEIPGLLVKTDPNKKYFIFSQSEQTRPAIKLYNSETGNISIITIDTIPEKCIFSNKKEEAYCFGALIYKPAKYPDDWYKGKVFNSESLYKINLTDGSVEVVYFFGEDAPKFDVINPKLTENNKFLMFQNKYDLTLWSINLSRINL